MLRTISLPRASGTIKACPCAECRQGEQAMGAWSPSSETGEDQGSKNMKDTRIAKDVTEVREPTDLQTKHVSLFLMMMN